MLYNNWDGFLPSPCSIVPGGEKILLKIFQDVFGKLVPDTKIILLETKQPTNSMEHSPWEANSHSASQEIPRLLLNAKFINIFTRAHHWSPSWARWIQIRGSV
jgi:hypothetical protein